MSTFIPLFSAGLRQLLLVVGAVVIVTVIALCRCNKADVPRIFDSFTAGFGIHRRRKSELQDTEARAMSDTRSGKARSFQTTSAETTQEPR